MLLTGSYAKGSASVASDLDVMVITSSEPGVSYRTWFEEQSGDAPLHVSAGATTATGWLEDCGSPARWSLGFPAINEAHYLWRVEEAEALVGASPTLLHSAAEPELEDFIDFVLKAKRSANSGDELGLRWFAHEAGLLAPTLLIPLNPERVVRDRRDALDAALTFSVAPANYRHDLTVCLGLSSASGAGVNVAVARLGRELLGFLREHAPDIDRQPDIARYLVDGTLERHLDLVEWSPKDTVRSRNEQTFWVE